MLLLLEFPSNRHPCFRRRSAIWFFPTSGTLISPTSRRRVVWRRHPQSRQDLPPFPPSDGPTWWPSLPARASQSVPLSSCSSTAWRIRSGGRTTPAEKGISVKKCSICDETPDWGKYIEQNGFLARIEQNSFLLPSFLNSSKQYLREPNYYRRHYVEHEVRARGI